MKINQRLFDHYGIDTNKDLNIVPSCARPFDTVLIDKQGSCYACECTAWLPQSIGNLQISPLSDILKSSMREHLQSTITDGTYRYCNAKQCTYIGKNMFDQARGGLRHLRLAIDDSCNLRCPSCRTGLIFRGGSARRLGIKLADRINEWLHTNDQDVQVHIGSDGDPFASNVYRHFMEQTPNKDNISYSILTNGLMFGEFHTRIPQIIENLTELGVSIDGASRETYEKLRLGGKWDKIIENLECISNIKKEHGFRFVMHFVVQKGNHHEMEMILDLGRKYGADKVNLSLLQDWGTFNDFQSQLPPLQDPSFTSMLERCSATDIANTWLKTG